MEEETDALAGIDPRALDAQAGLMVDYRRSIRRFIKDTWKLTPQPCKPAYQDRWDEVCRSTGTNWERLKKTVDASWFGDCVNPTAETEVREWVWYNPSGAPIDSREEFLAKNWYTWQQNLVLMGVEKAVAGDAPRHLSTVSGHGIGKSATCAWVVLWFLYCFYESQVPVTAPTSAQMHDVLWKEMSIWISRMPDDTRELYEWQHDYVRMNYAPESWFARARTSTKENTEAIAGVHSEHVCIVADEASGIPEQVFITAQGALTSGNVFVILISNGTRTIGYFYDTHHKDAVDNQIFKFDSEQSPIVDRKYVSRMLKKYARGSEEFTIRVAGGFPGEDVMDDSGYLQLIPESRIVVRSREVDIKFLGRKILGIDPSGEGKDLYTAVLRDRFKAALVKSRQTTNDKEIAEDILTLIDRYDIDPNDVVIGAFGIGHKIGKEIALATADMKRPYNVYTVLEGNSPSQEEKDNPHFFARAIDELTNPEGRPKEVIDMHLNIRSLMYFRARKWIFAGGQIIDDSVDNSDFANELAVIRYKRSLQGNKIQLMSKKEMLKLRIPSPNIADAFALTFLRELNDDVARETEDEREQREAEEKNMGDDERFGAL